MSKRLTTLRNWLILKIGPENWKDPVISNLLANGFWVFFVFVLYNIWKFVMRIFDSHFLEIYNFLLKAWTLPRWVILLLCLFTLMYFYFIIIYFRSKRSGEISSIPYKFNEKNGFVKEDFDRFRCYFANGNLVNNKCFEIEVFIESKQADFKLRTVQLCIVFNPDFISKEGKVDVVLVNESIQLKSNYIGNVKWSSEAYGFQSTASFANSCENGTVISVGQAKSLGKFSLNIENDVSFNMNTSPSARFVLPWQEKAPGLELTTAITKWATIDCSIRLSKTITQFGIYS